MSWQAYVDDHLMVELPSKSMLKSAAICGMDGGIWAKSEEFPDITDDQIAALVSALEKPDAEAKIQQEGFFIGDVKYKVIRGESGSVIRGRQAEGGAVIKKTTSALVIGTYLAEDHNNPIAGEANVVVEQLGDYLIAQGI